MAEKREALLPNNQHYTNRIDGTILYIYMMSMRLNWKREYAFLRNKWHNNIGYVSGSWWKSIGYDDEWRRVWKCSSFIIPLGQVHACSHVRKFPFCQQTQQVSLNRPHLECEIIDITHLLGICGGEKGQSNRRKTVAVPHSIQMTTP